MVTQPQTNHDRDPTKITDPIALKLPVPVQSNTFPISYQCEVVVPILLKIPIVVQIDVSSKPSLCQSNPQEPITPFTKSVQSSVELNSESLERRSDTLLSSDLSSSDLSSSDLLNSDLSSSDGANFDSSNIDSLPIATTIYQSSQRFKSRQPSKLAAKIHRFCPITVLAILLGSLLGAGCSSLLVKHLAKLNADRNCAIASVEATSLAVRDHCF